MPKTEKTSTSVATKASQVLRSPSASPAQRSLAGSALAQSGTSKTTSPTVASKASKALSDGRTGSTTRTLAGSVLTQKPKSR